MPQQIEEEELRLDATYAIMNKPGRGTREDLADSSSEAGTSSASTVEL